jgi:hypothetical protein
MVEGNILLFYCRGKGEDFGPVQLFMRSSFIVITEAKAEILDGPDIYVDRLSTLVLTCRVDFGLRTPDYIIWKKDDKVRIYSRKQGARAN